MIMNFSQLCVAGALTLEVLARGVNFVSALKHDASKESTTTRLIRKDTQILKKKQIIQDDFVALHDHRAIEEDVEMIWEESTVNLDVMTCTYKQYSMSADGKTFAISCKIDNDRTGRVRVYSLVDGQWASKGPDLIGQNEGEQFGSSVALSIDGNILAIGIHYRSTGNLSFSGCIEVYEYNGNGWTPMGGQIEGEVKNEHFGGGVSLSANGHILAGSGNAYVAKGSVRVYEFDDGQWKDLGSEISGQNNIDKVSHSLSLSDNGQVMAIGEEGYNSGSFSVYQYDDNNGWVQIGDTIHGDAMSFQLGYSLQLSGDSTTVIVGASGVAGYVEVYRYNDNESQWQQIGDNLPGLGLGRRVSISSDGDIILVPNQRNEDNNMGVVRAYKYSGTQWDQLGQDMHDDNDDDYFETGALLSGDGNSLIVKKRNGDVSVYTLTVASESPSISSLPSDTPSDTPSLSSSPSETPSETPSISSLPSDTPSDTPSLSSSPSDTPSNTPSLSSSPSETPSETPSISSFPSETPSEFGLQDILIAHVNSTFADGAVENGFVTLNTWYKVSSHVDTEKNVDVKLYTDQECNNEGIPAFLTQLDHTTHPAEKDEFQLVKSPKQINATMVEGENDNTALFCEAIQVWSSEPDSGGKVINEVRVKYTLIADPTNGQFEFQATINDSEDVPVQSLDVYPDAEITYTRCDGERPLKQGEKLCLRFSVSEEELELTDIDELKIELENVTTFGWTAIESGEEADKGIVEKNCSNGGCTVEILMFTQIFEYISDDVNSATLKGEGKAIISRNGKAYDDAEGNAFEISVELLKSDCDEEMNPLLDGAGGLFSLIVGNLNL